MTQKELKEKICEISNSEFPLIDFFNDIGWLDDRHFNTERAYEDIEKIYNVFAYYENKSKQLKEENAKLKQAIKILKTGSGFKVSKSISLDGTCNYLLDYKVGLINYGILLYEEQYELLKEVLEDE